MTRGKTLSGLHHHALFHKVCQYRQFTRIYSWKLKECHLICGIQPDCGEEQLIHLGSEHVGEPLRSTMQGDPAEEEDGQDKVREEGGEVNHLNCHTRLFSFFFYIIKWCLMMS